MSSQQTAAMKSDGMLSLAGIAKQLLLSAAIAFPVAEALGIQFEGWRFSLIAVLSSAGVAMLRIIRRLDRRLSALEREALTMKKLNRDSRLVRTVGRRLGLS